MRPTGGPPSARSRLLVVYPHILRAEQNLCGLDDDRHLVAGLQLQAFGRAAGDDRHELLSTAALPLIGGTVMMWARALGEFGATIIFAGNFPGRTQTMPLAISLGFELDLRVSLTLALILLVMQATSARPPAARVPSPTPCSATTPSTASGELDPLLCLTQ
jgi:hypothetical protein